VRGFSSEQRSREDQPERPTPQTLEQLPVSAQERTKLPAGGIGDDVDEDDLIGRKDTDRQLVREVPNRPIAPLNEHESRQLRRVQAMPLNEVRHLLSFGCEPGRLAIRENRIKNHQALDGSGHCRGAAMAIVGLADRAIQTLVMDVEDSSGSAPAGICGGVPLLRQSVKKVSCLLPEYDAGKRGVLPGKAYSGMEHD
jgi:hypothetical protein